jgi:hypothetical protein
MVCRGFQVGKGGALQGGVLRHAPCTGSAILRQFCELVSKQKTVLLTRLSSTTRPGRNSKFTNRAAVFMYRCLSEFFHPKTGTLAGATLKTGTLAAGATLKTGTLAAGAILKTGTLAARATLKTGTLEAGATVKTGIIATECGTCLFIFFFFSYLIYWPKRRPTKILRDFLM